MRTWYLTLIVIGCAPDAPHDNPLDPSSPSYTGTGAIQGYVTLLSDPRQGVAAAEVRVTPDGPIVLSSSDGSFSMPPMTACTAELIAAKEGFRADTQQVQVRPGTVASVELRLDALPVVSQRRIVTQKIDAYFPGPVYLANISAEVSDPDGLADLDSVWCAVGNITSPMSFNPDSHLYEVTLFDYQLPTNNIHWLVGKEVRIFCMDDSGALNSEGDLFVTRIIEESATAVSPVDGDTVAASPLLEWRPAPVTFFYTLTLRIVQQHSGTQTLIWSQDKVDANAWSLRYPSTLAPGSYFWTIAVVDEFGNVSQGRPSSFLVE